MQIQIIAWNTKIAHSHTDTDIWHMKTGKTITNTDRDIEIMIEIDKHH